MRRPGDTAATLIPSVGCPMGCNFCATSAMFGGKGKFVHFYETGDELFEVMCELEEAMGVRSFFVMDENFLLYRKRALRLLDLMAENDKPWALYVFSSANVLQSLHDGAARGAGDLLGLDGPGGPGRGLRQAQGDRHAAIGQARCRATGSDVLGSTIIGLEEHTPENIDAAIEHAVAHDTEFHQFMLYTPVGGTPLHAEHVENGTLLDRRECPEADRHGQFRFSHTHPHIGHGQETEFPAKGVRSRLQGKRTEHREAGANDATGVAAVQEPSRGPDTQAVRLGGPASRSRLHRCVVGGPAVVSFRSGSRVEERFSSAKLLTKLSGFLISCAIPAVS